MLTPMDDSLWHQLPTTFDHAGTSDPRFFGPLLVRGPATPPVRERCS